MRQPVAGWRSRKPWNASRDSSSITQEVSAIAAAGAPGVDEAISKHSRCRRGDVDRPSPGSSCRSSRDPRRGYRVSGRVAHVDDALSGTSSGRRGRQVSPLVGVRRAGKGSRRRRSSGPAWSTAFRAHSTRGRQLRPRPGRLSLRMKIAPGRRHRRGLSRRRFRPFPLPPCQRLRPRCASAWRPSSAMPSADLARHALLAGRCDFVTLPSGVAATAPPPASRPPARPARRPPRRRARPAVEAVRIDASTRRSHGDPARDPPLDGLGSVSPPTCAIPAVAAGRPPPGVFRCSPRERLPRRPGGDLATPFLTRCWRTPDGEAGSSRPGCRCGRGRCPRCGRAGTAHRPRPRPVGGVRARSPRGHSAPAAAVSADELADCLHRRADCLSRRRCGSAYRDERGRGAARRILSRFLDCAPCASRPPRRCPFPRLPDPATTAGRPRRPGFPAAG
jgi:hypothetical protein